jgi:hypothetical protein
MEEVDRFESSTGNTVVLSTNGTQWQVANLTREGEVIWTENLRKCRAAFQRRRGSA